MHPDPAALRALLERVEQATGADRELDAALWCALLHPDRKPSKSRPGFVAITDDDPSRWGYKEIKHYTASVDAALALVERVLKEPHYTLSGPVKFLHIPTPVPNYWRADIIYDFPGKNAPRGWGATAALTLLAALLRAKIAEIEHDG